MHRGAALASIALACGLGTGGCATGPDLAAPAGSRRNPIVCSGRPDEIAYLERLRCPDGTPARWERAGNTPIGPHGAAPGGRERRAQLRRDGRL